MGNSDIDRRNLLKLTGAAAAAAGAGLFAPTVLAAEALTGVFYLPQSYKALSFGANGFVEKLKANSSHAVSVDYFDSGKLMKADEQLPALRSGAVNFMFHTTSYITRSVPILGITGLPNVVDALHKHPERFAKGSPLFNLVNDELAKEDLVMLSMMGNILEPEFIWSTKAAPIASIADMAGKKIRVVSFEATGVAEKFGAAAVRIPSSELYLALQRGTVDAAVANISTVIGRSLHEQLHVVYKLPVTAYGIGLFMTKGRFDHMGGDVKQALNEAADWLDAEGAKMANDKIYPDEYWPIVKKTGIEIVEPSADDLAKLAEASAEVVAAWKASVGEEVGQRAIDLALGKISG